jgi:quinol monooxygenase YgiN
MSIAMVVTLTVQDGKGEELESVFRELGALVRKNEPGNQAYKLAKSRTEPNVYKVLEIYADQDALTAHGSSEHFRAHSPRMGGCLAGRPTIEYLDGID